ncbi:MAG TPA: universal stress protein [Chloroflexota bacterium]|jgi:nucleotide-binding universal stress UspA family protein|nr:universal stress protein [Chloroflexota bacterium]
MPMTILVPLDGSALAERALPYAVRLAHRTGAAIALLRAVLAHTFPGTDPTEAEVKVTQEAEAALEQVAAGLRAQGLAASVHVYYDTATSAIVDAMRVLPADLVVMSTHGRSGLGRWLYGSVAEHVLQHATAPVLLVPARCRREWAAAAVGPVVVGLDGSPLAEAALAPAAQLAAWLDSGLVLAQVVEPIVPVVTDGAAYVPPFDEEAELAAARQYLSSLIADPRLAGRLAEVVAEVGDPATMLVRVADERQAAALALATHGRTGLARIVLGSVAIAVVQRADVPLLVYRPVEMRPPESAAPPQEPAVTVGLSRGELALVERALATLLREGSADADRATAAALLARLRQLAGEPGGG